ncbi:MAG: tRNA (N(6)-L-threonylcarbamoyladenosine(37)-C(2))-methylthiotransferase MtaB [Sphaerochaetaceae bacterium]
MRVLIYTLGCKLNQCESEAIAAAFTQEGFEVVAGNAEADLYIVNTCTVTSKAEQKARRMIRRYAKAGVVLITGCYAQMERDALSKIAGKVVVISLDDKPNLLALPSFLAASHIGDIELYDALKEFALTCRESNASVFDYEATSFTYHSRAFLKIQDGCDNTCGYCRVSIARGAARSLSLEEVAKRALVLEKEGFHEVVLTGVNISAYQDGATDLAKLLKELLKVTGSDTRLRLSSLEPDRLNHELIEVCGNAKIQSHFHLPLQSGSPVVLKRVNRHYSLALVEQLIKELRAVKEDPFIAADVITGLPGEDAAEFSRSMEFYRENEFSQFHVFPFSPRPQTALWEAKDRVSESIRDERAKIVRDLSTIHFRRYKNRQIGRTLEAIVEQKQGSAWFGLTGNYLKVPLIGVPPNVERGDLLKVRVEVDKKSTLLTGKALID